MNPPVPGLMLAAIIEAGTVALLCWWFVWRYSRIKWRSTPEGRHVMRLTVVLGLTFTFTVLFNTIPVSLLLKALVSLVLFGAIAAEMWTRINLLADAQRDRGDTTD